MAFTNVPAVVGAGGALVDLLPRVLADVVDVERGCRRRSGRTAMRNGLRRPRVERLLAARPGSRAVPVTLQRAVSAPWKGLSAGIPPSG